MRARSTAALITVAPRRGAGTEDNSPWNRPSGVRTAAAMTMGSLELLIVCSFARARHRPARWPHAAASAIFNYGRNLYLRMMAGDPAVKRPLAPQHGGVPPLATSIRREVADGLGVGTFYRAQFVRRETELLHLIDGALCRQERVVGPEQQAIGRQKGADRRHGARVGGADDIEMRPLQGAGHSFQQPRRLLLRLQPTQQPAFDAAGQHEYRAARVRKDEFDVGAARQRSARDQTRDGASRVEHEFHGR